MSAADWFNAGKAAARSARFEIGSLFAPEPYLPQQLPRSNHRSGEQRLALAVIKDAIHRLDMLAPKRANQTYRAKFLLELRWFTRCDDRWPYSFESLCDALGLDASALREAIIARYKELPHGIAA